jgi:hypothetical protein
VATIIASSARPSAATASDAVFRVFGVIIRLL